MMGATNANACWSGVHIYIYTTGPIISGNTGIRTIDVGVPSLSMHSIRETIGVSDILNSRVLFENFFEHFRELDESFAQDTALCPPCTKP